LEITLRTQIKEGEDLSVFAGGKKGCAKPHHPTMERPKQNSRRGRHDYKGKGNYTGKDFNMSFSNYWENEKQKISKILIHDRHLKRLVATGNSALSQRSKGFQLCLGGARICAWSKQTKEHLTGKREQRLKITLKAKTADCHRSPWEGEDRMRRGRRELDD